MRPGEASPFDEGAEPLRAALEATQDNKLRVEAAILDHENEPIHLAHVAQRERRRPAAQATRHGCRGVFFLEGVGPAVMQTGEADLTPTIALQDATDPAMDFAYLNSETTSVRIDLDWRAVGILHGDEVVWFWIGPHAE